MWMQLLSPFSFTCVLQLPAMEEIEIASSIQGFKENQTLVIGKQIGYKKEAGNPRD